MQVEKCTFKHDIYFKLSFFSFLGEPPAHDVVWKLAGRQLDVAPGNGIKIDNSKPYKSILIKEGLTRRDGGALVCTATNMEGNASNQLGKFGCPKNI